MSNKSSPHYDEVCGYRILRVLPTQRGIVAAAPGGRKVVLKLMESDCMLKGQLHPSIKERLGRVRELAQMQVANLHSVEREGNEAYLVWEHLDGETFDEFVAGNRSLRDMMLAAREIVLMVESLHAQGIIHGSLHARNIIHGLDNRWRLTHVSPLLFNDHAEDAKAIVATLKEAMVRRREENTDLGELLGEAETTAMPLRTLRSRLAAIIEAREVAPTSTKDRDDEDTHTRKKAFYAAAAVAALGAIIAGGVWVWVRQASARQTAPGVPQTTARQPEPQGRAPSVIEAKLPTG